MSSSSDVNIVRDIGETSRDPYREFFRFIFLLLFRIV